MSRRVTRRQFLATTCLTAAAPTIIRGSALGKNGSVAPSNRIVLGGIGIGARGALGRCWSFLISLPRRLLRRRWCWTSPRWA